MIKLPIFALGPPHRKLVAYDSANRLANLALAGSAGLSPAYSVDYGYDTRGLLASVTSGDYASTYTYRSNGQLLSTVSSKLSTPQGDILRADRTYDAGARLLGVANTAANNDQAGVLYTLGLDDQRLTATEESGEKWDYGYDGLKQLVTAKKTDTGAAVVPPLDQSYTYDPMGNRRAYADQSASTAYTANNANQYTAVGGIASVYDANGNLLSDGVKNYSWDAENQLIAVTPVSPVTGSQKVEYTYDWRMRRTGKKSYTYTSGTWTLTKSTGFKYHEWNPIQEIIVDHPLSSPVSSLKSYVWGNDLSGNLHGAGGVGGLLAMQYAGDTYFHAYDGNGNVRALVKADAANPAASGITARYAYDGFGKEVAVSGVDADKNAFRFSTKQLDTETGMNYYGYRFYDANNGRWINRDPIAEKGGLNLYEIIGNKVVANVDKLGMASVTVTGGASWTNQTSDSGTRSISTHEAASMQFSHTVNFECKDGKLFSYNIPSPVYLGTSGSLAIPSKASTIPFTTDYTLSFNAGGAFDSYPEEHVVISITDISVGAYGQGVSITAEKVGGLPKGSTVSSASYEGAFQITCTCGDKYKFEQKPNAQLNIGGHEYMHSNFRSTWVGDQRSDKIYNPGF